MHTDLADYLVVFQHAPGDVDAVVIPVCAGHVGVDVGIDARDAGGAGTVVERHPLGRPGRRSLGDGGGGGLGRGGRRDAKGRRRRIWDGGVAADRDEQQQKEDEAGKRARDPGVGEVAEEAAPVCLWFSSELVLLCWC